MTENDIKAMIGDAAVERKACLDKISCYEARMKNAVRGLQAVMDPDNNQAHEDNRRIVDHPSDPREDAKGYLAALERAQELSAFLRKHNAL